MAELIFVKRGIGKYGVFHTTGENDGSIKINTSTPVEHLYIQSTAPTEEGNIAWIDTDIKNKIIDLDKKVMINQSLSGAFVKQNDEWVPVDTEVYANDTPYYLWSGELVNYYRENDINEIIGGFTSVAKNAASNSSANKYAPDVEWNIELVTDGIQTTEVVHGLLVDTDTPSGDNGGMWHSVNKIDLTPYKTLVFKGDFSRGGTVQRNFTLAAWTSIGTYYTSNTAAYIYMTGTTGTEIRLDVSNINQECYVGLGLVNSKALIRQAYLVPKEG